jgi:hypothetical protein
VTPSQAFGNGERVAQPFFLREPEHALGSGVPQSDRATGVGDDNRAADHGDQLFEIDGGWCLHGAIHG